jgi:predicted nucleic acid-binding Zn ribbon protein
VRVDARLCSPACRSREYRKRQKKAQVNAETSR